MAKENEEDILKLNKDLAYMVQSMKMVTNFLRDMGVRHPKPEQIIDFIQRMYNVFDGYRQLDKPQIVPAVEEPESSLESVEHNDAISEKKSKIMKKLERAMKNDHAKKQYDKNHGTPPYDGRRMIPQIQPPHQQPIPIPEPQDQTPLIYYKVEPHRGTQMKWGRYTLNWVSDEIHDDNHVTFSSSNKPIYQMNI